MLTFDKLSESEQELYRDVTLRLLKRAKKIDVLWEKVKDGEFFIRAIFTAGVSALADMGVAGWHIVVMTPLVLALVAFISAMHIKYGGPIDFESFGKELINIAKEHNL